MSHDRAMCKVGEVYNSLLYPADKESAVLFAIDQHRLLYPAAEFEFDLQYLNACKFPIGVCFVALVVNPSLSTDTFTELVDFTVPRVVNFSKETRKAKAYALSFFNKQAISMIELANPRPGASREVITTAAMKYVAQFSKDYWAVTAGWLAASIYFYPNYNHTFQYNNQYTIPAILLAQRLHSPSTYYWEREDRTINTVLQDDCSPFQKPEDSDLNSDIIWLSLVLAEAEALAEMLNFITLIPTNKSHYNACYKLIKNFITTKHRQIVMFEDGDVGLWELAFNKINQLNAIMNIKL